MDTASSQHTFWLFQGTLSGRNTAGQTGQLKLTRAPTCQLGYENPYNASIFQLVRKDKDKAFILQRPSKTHHLSHAFVSAMGLSSAGFLVHLPLQHNESRLTGAASHTSFGPCCLLLIWTQQTPQNAVNNDKIKRGATVRQIISEHSEQWHWILPLHKLRGVVELMKQTNKFSS